MHVSRRVVLTVWFCDSAAGRMIYKELDILLHTSGTDYSSRTHEGDDPVPTEGRKTLSGIFQGFP